jgi:peptidoglycan hydrolase-like protein with peptidoglycan-binding domain
MGMQLGEAQLSTGSSGEEVKKIQQILQGQGYNVGPVDGLYGPQTQAAVQAFQKTKGLLPDGIVGPLTWSALQGTPVTPTPLPAAPVPRTMVTGVDRALSMFSGFSPMMLAGIGIGVMFLFSKPGKKRRR